MIDILHQKPLLGRQINWAHPLAKGLKFFVPMNEGSGFWATDVVSKTAGVFDANMTETAWIPGKDGWALDFDGTNDRIDFANFWDGVGPQTLAFWIYPDSVAVNQYFFISNPAGTGILIWISSGANPGNIEVIYVFDGDNPSHTSNDAVISAGSWQHIAITWDGSTTGTNILIYVNGSEVGYQGSANGTNTQTAIGGSYSIGGRDTDDNRNINAKFANFGWWDRVLGQTERTWVYREPYAMFQQNRARRFSVGGVALTASIADTVGISDDLATVGTFIKVLADTLGITDTINTARNLKIALADTEDITDTITTSKGAVRGIADSVGITDAIITAKGAVRSIADSVGISDVLSKIGTFIKSIADTVGTTDTVTTSKGAVRSIDDTVGITDVLSKIGTYKRSISDTAGITDTTATSKGVIRSIADSVGISDVLSTLLIRVVSIADTVGITDVITYIKTVVVAPFVDTISGISRIIKSISTDSGMTKSQSKKSEINKNITGDSEL